MSNFTVIPPGYRLTVTSWENDADNYNTNIVEGMSRENVYLLVDIIKLCKSKNQHKGCFGNMLDPNETQLYKFGAAIAEVIKKHNILDTSFADYFLDDENNLIGLSGEDDYYELIESIIELLYPIGLTGGEFYLRVMDSFKVEYLPTEIKIQDVTEEFA